MNQNGVSFTLKRLNPVMHLSSGCVKLHLQMRSGPEYGKKMLDIVVCSGQPDYQFFRKAGDPRNVPGNMEPLPQGVYTVGDIEWANGKNSYTGSWGLGLGPVWVPITCAEEKNRGGFGIHLDANRDTCPGTAGCVGILDLSTDLYHLVAALRAGDPKTLVVDWGLD